MPRVITIIAIVISCAVTAGTPLNAAASFGFDSSGEYHFDVDLDTADAKVKKDPDGFQASLKAHFGDEAKTGKKKAAELGLSSVALPSCRAR